CYGSGSRRDCLLVSLSASRLGDCLPDGLGKVPFRALDGSPHGLYGAQQAPALQEISEEPDRQAAHGFRHPCEPCDLLRGFFLPGWFVVLTNRETPRRTTSPSVRPSVAALSLAASRISRSTSTNKLTRSKIARGRPAPIRFPPHGDMDYTANLTNIYSK